jgi:FlaA1/EpsC-like NDP-sugar epimerase/lipopolysaccharide/colanic/teichoic acid biosynthesis glycosyltransferase
VKRLIDISVSLTALIVLAPLFAIIAIAIKLESRGPVLFRQERMGRGMRRFRVFKFRTMAHAPGSARGPVVTVQGDRRITRVGAFLRKSKLDEFPQFVNVLLGQMSLVGPRPEVPEYVELFAKDYEIILGVRPGLTDPASFKYRHEGAILAASANPEREYLERILPDKIRLAKTYVAESCLSLDLALILKTLLEAVGMEAAPVGRSVVKHRRPIVMTIHLILVILAYYLAWQLRFDGRIPPREMQLFWQFLPWLLFIRAIFFAVFRLYQGLWRYTSLWDGASIVAAVLLSVAPFVLVVRVFHHEAAHPRSVFVIDAGLLIALMIGVRLIRRVYHELEEGRPGVKVLVFGAADTGEMMIRELKKSERYRVIGLLDDDPDKRGRRIHGVPVLGGRHQLPGILARQKPAEVLVALGQANPAVLQDLVRLVEPFSVKLTMLPTVVQSLEPHVELSQVRSVRLEDLLSRPVISTKPGALATLIAGRRVLVTGAGGSLGSELARQIALLRPRSLVLLDRNESRLHAIGLELERGVHQTATSAIMGDVTDAAWVNGIMQGFRPEIVFHLATHKHVRLMEANPCEAVKNNVGGTRVLGEAAERHGVDRFILISSDKAVHPTGVMSATKRVAELVIQSIASGSRTSFTTVRLGNVLGRHGSVIHRFMDQIRAGGPVTVTHPEMRRYFMLVPDAAHLVLLAATELENGATYVLPVGEQVKLADMARNLIRLSGFVPDQEVRIEFIGLRPAEILHEEMVATDEDVFPSAVDRMLRVRSRSQPGADFMSRVEALERSAFEGRHDAVLSELRDLAGAIPPPAAQVASAEAAVTQPAGLPAAVHHVPAGQRCPKCETGQVQRSRARSLRERFRRELTTKRIYRCEACGWRGWQQPMDFGDQALAEDVASPDLDALDSAVKRDPAAPRTAFSPRNLQ